MATAKFHQGEKVGIVGQLLLDEQVQTDWLLQCQLRTACGTVIRRIPMTFYPDESTYGCSVDTTDLKGTVKLRFIAEGATGDKVIANEDLTLKIYE